MLLCGSMVRKIHAAFGWAWKRVGFNDARPQAEVLMRADTFRWNNTTGHVTGP